MSISLLSKGMGHSDMSRNWCARVNFPSKQLRGGVNHLALGSINPYYHTGWGEQGSREISHHRVGGSVNNNKKTCPTCHVKHYPRLLPGVLWEPGKVLDPSVSDPLGHHWLGGPESPLGLGNALLPVAPETKQSPVGFPRPSLVCREQTRL